MYYDPYMKHQGDTENKIDHKGLAPTIISVKEEGNKIVEEKDEYKDLLEKLAQSDFVKEMHKLRTEIIE